MSSHPGRSLRQAVLTAVLLVVLMGAAAAAGRRGFFVLVVFVVVAAVLELLDGLVQAGYRPSLAVGVAGTLGMLGVAYDGRLGWLAAVPAVTMLAGFVYALRPDRGATPSTDVAWTVLAVVWIAGGGAGAVTILTIEPGGLELLFATILIAALDDIGGYFGGTRLGRHKMAPSISPAKSWEGFASALACTLLGGIAAGGILDELAVADGLALGAICGLLAPIGDLAESMFKREVGIKDSGRMLPGHGGFLDRLDAIFFCMPALALYLRLVVA